MAKPDQVALVDKDKAANGARLKESVLPRKTTVAGESLWLVRTRAGCKVFVMRVRAVRVRSGGHEVCAAQGSHQPHLRHR